MSSTHQLFVFSRPITSTEAVVTAAMSGSLSRYDRKALPRPAMVPVDSNVSRLSRSKPMSKRIM